MKILIMLWGKKLLNNYSAVFPAFVLVMLVSVSSCGPKAEEKAKEKFVLSDSMRKRIELHTVDLESIKNVINLNGKITPDDNKKVDVYPIVGGNVVSVSAELGDYVQKGQTLAVIRSGEVADYENELIDAESDLLVAQKNLKVQQDLYDAKLNSERDLVAARKDLDKANAELKRIKEFFTIYSINAKSEYIVKAPISGFIIYKNINTDMTIPADRNESIFTVAQIEDVWVIANVYETEISRIREGMEAEISTLSYPDSIMYGKVDKIFNVLDPDTKTMKIRVILKNPNYKLKPEMQALVKLKFEDTDKKLAAVPAQAVLFDNSRQYVMVFKGNDNIETREVQVYKTTGNTSWISKGLLPGEVIISKNQLYIYDALND